LREKSHFDEADAKGPHFGVACLYGIAYFIASAGLYAVRDAGKRQAASRQV